MRFFIGLLASTALYGVVALLVCVLALGVSMSDVFDGAGRLTTFTEAFYAYMLLSIAVLPVAHVLNYAVGRVVYLWERRQGYGVRGKSYFASLPRILAAEATNPFRGLLALKGSSKVIDSRGLWFLHDWGQTISHFVWAVAFWVLWAAGFAAVLVS